MSLQSAGRILGCADSTRYCGEPVVSKMWKVALIAAAVAAVGAIALVRQSAEDASGDLEAFRVQLEAELPLTQRLPPREQFKVLLWAERLSERKLKAAFRRPAPKNPRLRLQQLQRRFQELGVDGTLAPRVRPAAVRKRYHVPERNNG